MMEQAEIGQFLARRHGKLTASRMEIAMRFNKDGKPSAARTKYMQELLAERVVDFSVRHFVSDAMRHGIEFEDEAKMAYEAATGNLIADTRQFAQHGVFDHPTIENFAASPDGMLDHDGLLETKCPQPMTFVEWVMAGVVPEEHKPQMICQCVCTGRRWVEFVAYEPRLVVAGRRLFIRRYEPTQAERDKVEAEAVKFLNELEDMFSLFVEAGA